MVSPVFHLHSIDDPSSADAPLVTSFQKFVSALLIISMLVPPGAAYSAPSKMLPLAAFAPAPKPSPNPFAWPPVSHWIPSPKLLPKPGKTPGFHDEFASTWKLPQRRPGSTFSPHPSGAGIPWSPSQAPLDGEIPLPDGMPTQSPFPLAATPQAQPGMPLEAGNCIIAGEVSDSSSLNPVPGAIIDAVGTGRSAESDASGKFRIEGLPPGTYTLEAAKLGYFSETLVITAIEAQPTEARFGLRLKPTDDSTAETTLEEETIVGEYQGEGQGDFNLDLAVDSPNISAGLSKDDFSRTGAGDAGAAVSKIAGANIVGGRYAVVRGLGDRYSNTLFNGALIPSADPTRKAVQLDLFPTDLIESVAITKLFLPELPAEFAGGTVQIQTLRLPEKPIAEVSIGTRWFSERPDGDFLGDPFTNTKFDEIEYPTLPEGFDQPNGFTGSVVDSVALHESAVMRPSAVEDDQALSLSLVLGNTFKLYDGIRLGTVFALTRDNRNTYEDRSLGRGYRLNNPNTPGIDPNVINTRRNEVFTRELTFGYMAGATLELGERNDIGYTKFYNEAFGNNYFRTTNSRTINAEPVFTANPYDERDPLTGEIVRVFAMPIGAADYFEPLQRSLDVDQFNGRHVLYGDKERGGSFSWLASKATAIEARPHSRTYNYTPLEFSDPAIQNFTFAPGQYRPDYPIYEGAGDPVLLSGFPVVTINRESLETVDIGENQRADVSLPYYFKEDSDDRVGIRFGYNQSQRDRQVRGRFYTYDFNRINDRLLIENSEGTYQGSYGNLFHQNFNSAFFPDRPDKPIFGSNDITINDFSGNGSTVRNIDAGTRIESTYIGGDVSLGGWTISGGARLESEERSYQILPGLNPAIIANPRPVVVAEDSILPGVVITKPMGTDDAVMLTAGWSRTIARPTFYEFAPAFVVDQATGDVTRGNPGLVNSSISNFDLRADWKASQKTNVGAGLFSKFVENPIVDAFDPVLNAQSWINGDSGVLNGVELEANTLLLDRWRIGGNYTYIDSSLQYTLRGIPLNTGFTGQPSHIFNLFTGYENSEQGVSANLIYNFTGSFLSAAPADPNVPGIVEEAFQTLDFIFQKSFRTWECDGKVTLGVRNILDSTRSQVFDGTEITFRQGKPGRIFSVSCEVNF
jgi:hypothetical protein